MPVIALHHYTLRCAPSDLAPLREFYTRHIGLTVGPRPDAPAPGVWLYCGGQPIVHLYAIAPEGEVPAALVTGPLDHISFRAHGLAQTRAYFKAQGIPYDEAPIPDWPIHQVFLKDPMGLKIELTFMMDDEPVESAPHG